MTFPNRKLNPNQIYVYMTYKKILVRGQTRLAWRHLMQVRAVPDLWCECSQLGLHAPSYDTKHLHQTAKRHTCDRTKQKLSRM